MAEAGYNRPVPRSSNGEQAPPSQLSEEIRLAILRGEYGPGQRLIEGDICKRFKASRFAVRTALQELAGHGLIDFTHNRGARVHEVSVREALEIMEVRRLLVGLIAARAAEHATDDECERLAELRGDLRTALAADNFVEYRVTTRAIQQLFQTASRHTVAAALLRQLHDRSARYTYTLSMLPNGSRASLSHYEAIIDAILDRDPVRAGDAARAHLASMIEALSEWASHFSEEHLDSDQAGAVLVTQPSVRPN